MQAMKPIEVEKVKQSPLEKKKKEKKKEKDEKHKLFF